MNCKIKLTLPSDKDSVICPGRHIAVWAGIKSDEPTPDGCTVVATLTDACGNVIRHTKATRKNDPSALVYHPLLTCYPEEMDPGHGKLREFGFPELMPDENGSLTNAAVKMWYSDTEIKTFFVAATDAAHGMLLDDGLSLTDENGQPYTAFPCGDYVVSVCLYSPSGELIASDKKDIRIAPAEKTVICRFNPASHKAKMMEWAKEMGFTLVSDILPGYLDSYLGVWLYHMGILPMYRASDVSLYQSGKVHMFVYLISHDSTSYETELAYLGESGAVGDPERFTAFRYDIGEAVVCPGRKDEKKGSIVEFGKDEYLHICRIDKVNSLAKEGHLDLSFDSVIGCETDTAHIPVKAGDTIAVSGVLRPYQLDRKAYVRRDDNTYEMKNGYDTVKYTLSSGDDVRVLFRSVGMTRYAGKDIGDSVFEFYNLIKITDDMAGKTYNVSIAVYDRHGSRTKAAGSVTLCVGK